MSKKNDRNVKFNVAIANYRPGQIIRYGDMPDGHKFWVDHDSILTDTRICEFVEEEKKKEAPKKEPEGSKEPKVEPGPDADKTKAAKGDDPAPKDEYNGEKTADIDMDKKPSFLNADGTKGTCPGKNKDGSPCKSTKLMENGYCYFHQDQAPTGLSGKMPENIKPIIGLTK